MLRDNEAAPLQLARPSVSQKDVRREAAARREALAPLRKQISAVERTIEMLRAEIDKLDRELAAPDLYTDPEKAAAVAKARAGHVHDFARAESEWLDLSAELEVREAEALAG